MEYQKTINNYYSSLGHLNAETSNFFNDNSNPSISRSLSENNGFVDKNLAHRNLYLNDSISIKRSGSLQYEIFNPINSCYKNTEYSEKNGPNQYLQTEANINQNLNNLNSYETEPLVSNEQGHKLKINNFPLLNFDMRHYAPASGENAFLSKVSNPGLGITQGTYIGDYKKIEKTKKNMKISHNQPNAQYQDKNKDNHLKANIFTSGKNLNSDSRGKKRPVESDNESKKAAREHANKKMRDWRRKKAILNRLNDMRCRVYMECRKKFGNDTSQTAKDWIRKEMDERIARTDFKKLQKKQAVYSKSIVDKKEEIKLPTFIGKKIPGISPNQVEKYGHTNQIKSTKDEIQTNTRYARFDNCSDVSSGGLKYVQNNEGKNVVSELKRVADSEINNGAKRINIKTQVHRDFYGINNLSTHPNMKKNNPNYIETRPIIYSDFGVVEGLSSNFCRNKSDFDSYTNKLDENVAVFNKQLENPSLNLKGVGDFNNNFILTPSW
ncbi:hypothetical protein AYI70_g3824 [Smittium culicis]|uniref:DUF3020 domain-containing protein n=1 Tax=Smittium culicis TaxID=133412 RepID=A0A1R1Y1Q0_9FUNG|nr:hypothetical protein AYI70_g3824 [Smittium culicis]